MKRLAALFTVLFMLCAHGVFAEKQYIHDEASVIADENEEILLSQMKEVGEKHGVDIVIVTNDEVDDDELVEYADDYYDYGGYGEDGFLILLNPYTGSRYISTSGKAIDAFDGNLSELSERSGEYFDNGEYSRAFSACIAVADELLTSEGNPDIFTTSEDSPDIFMGIIISLVFGFVIAFIVTGVMKSNLKSVSMQNAVSEYIKQGSFNLTRSRDLFLYRTVSKRARPKSSSGSGTHRSSSGRSHGGGRF